MLSIGSQELYPFSRQNWPDSPDASEADLKKRTLTNLYNARPTWLANAHAALKRAVWDACGWPAEVAADAILSRLLALDPQRSEPQGTCGGRLHCLAQHTRGHHDCAAVFPMSPVRTHRGREMVQHGFSDETIRNTLVELIFKQALRIAA